MSLSLELSFNDEFNDEFNDFSFIVFLDLGLSAEEINNSAFWTLAGDSGKMFLTFLFESTIFDLELKAADDDGDAEVSDV